MLGLPIFRRSTVTADCEACGVRFDTTRGGVCARCRRILCDEHLHGSWARRMMVELGASAMCVECRAGGGPAAGTITGR
ncbi:MAG TPA: hypothetical protein VFS44_00730 [Gemmatimonadaceae bacterium]|nr:hypothetical protein [Gemmatimonadaceae bacterium]